MNTTDEPLRVNLSVQGETVARLAQEMDRLQAQAQALASKIGAISQQYLILSEAMRLSLSDLNGGAPPPPTTRYLFPELNRRDR